jgi:hypothetical protein
VANIFSQERKFGDRRRLPITFTETFFSRAWHNLCSLQFVHG